MAKLTVKTLGDLLQDEKNVRKHNPRNLGLLVDSLREVGAARSGVVDETGRILAGNLTADALAAVGIERVIEVETDGSEWVVVKRQGLTERAKQRLAMYDNLASDAAVGDLIHGYDAEAVFALVAEDETILDGLWADVELEELFAGVSGDDTLKQFETDDKIPEMELAPFEGYDYILLVFRDTRDWLRAIDFFDIGPAKVVLRQGLEKSGIGRALDGARVLNRLAGDE